MARKRKTKKKGAYVSFADRNTGKLLGHCTIRLLDVNAALLMLQREDTLQAAREIETQRAGERECE